MDRQIVYPGAIPLDTDILTTERNIMKAVGFLAQATLGTATVFDGLACTQQTVPNMTVQVGPGSALLLSTVDASSFGSLSSDASPLVKMGINTASVTLNTPAPGTTGQSINYLVQAAFSEADATSVVLPYYNSSNPAVPYSGPANAGTPQNTQRLQTVNVSVKAGTPATTGTQTTPAPDSGFTGLYVVTVAFGASSVINANIVAVVGAPMLSALAKVPQIAPLAASYSVVGTTRGLVGSAAGGTLAASWTASELVAETALGGLAYKGNGLSLTFNAAGTGAGGMDTGSIPAAGDLSVYAIYNPVTNTWNTLGVAGATSNGPIYTGTHMPAGYTASALIWAGVTASSQFRFFYQRDRKIWLRSLAHLNGIVTNATYTSSGAATTLIPVAAVSFSGEFSINSSVSNTLYLASDTSGAGQQIVGATIASATAPGVFGDIPFITPQTYFYRIAGSSATITTNIDSYTI